MADLKVGVVGAAGRMGRMLVHEITATDGCAVAGAIEHEGHDAIGQDAGALAGIDPIGIAVADDPAQLFADCDSVIDFSSPEATTAHSALAAQSRSTLVIGTTGLDTEQQGEIEKAARHTAIVQAPNMSLGVNLLFALTEQVARALDPAYDIEIVEMHHKHKVDAPSGTALGLGRAAAAGRGVDLEAVAQRARDGQTGPRKSGNIGFAALRGGDVVGDHTVIFATEGERVELTHKAANRQIYARGAVRAALWAGDKSPGLYGMADVLGLGR